MDIQTTISKAAALPLILLLTSHSTISSNQAFTVNESKYAIAVETRYSQVYDYALQQPVETSTMIAKQEPELKQAPAKIVLTQENSTPIKPHIEVKTVQTSPAPQPTISEATTIPASQFDEYFAKYSAEYNVDIDMMKQIAKCESGIRAEAVNGPYGGMFQFISSTWVSNRRAMGLDENPDLRFNGEEAIKTAAFKMSRDGFGAWPACSRKAIAQREQSA